MAEETQKKNSAKNKEKPQSVAASIGCFRCAVRIRWLYARVLVLCVFVCMNGEKIAL